MSERYFQVVTDTVHIPAKVERRAVVFDGGRRRYSYAVDELEHAKEMARGMQDRGHDVRLRWQTEVVREAKTMTPAEYSAYLVYLAEDEATSEEYCELRNAHGAPNHDLLDAYGDPMSAAA